jgi:hypothetical protein
MIFEDVALIFLGLGADSAVQTSINGDKGDTAKAALFPLRSAKKLT